MMTPYRSIAILAVCGCGQTTESVPGSHPVIVAAPITFSPPDGGIEYHLPTWEAVQGTITRVVAVNRIEVTFAYSTHEPSNAALADQLGLNSPAEITLRGVISIKGDDRPHRKFLEDRILDKPVTVFLHSSSGRSQSDVWVDPEYGGPPGKHSVFLNRVLAEWGLATFDADAGLEPLEPKDGILYGTR